jgi:hypothetical protein
MYGYRFAQVTASRAEIYPEMTVLVGEMRRTLKSVCEVSAYRGSRIALEVFFSLRHGQVAQHSAGNLEAVWESARLSFQDTSYTG